MRTMKALSANYFLKAFLQTFPMAYYNCPGQKSFTFKLPGKCNRARDSVTGYAALRDTVTSRHTGPDQEEFFPPKLTMMGLTNWHHFWPAHRSWLSQISRKMATQFPVLYQSNKL